MTGLEPATSGVTGRHSNQLSYTRVSQPERRCAAARGVVYAGLSPPSSDQSVDKCILAKFIENIRNLAALEQRWDARVPRGCVVSTVVCA